MKLNFQSYFLSKKVKACEIAIIQEKMGMSKFLSKFQFMIKL